MTTMTYSNCDNCIHNKVCNKKQELFDFVGEVKPLIDMRTFVDGFKLTIHCENHKMESPTPRTGF